MNLISLNMLNLEMYYNDGSSIEYILGSLAAIVFIVFVILPLLKFPITDIAKRKTKNPYYKTRNILGFYEDVNESGELYVLETKKYSILFKITAISLSLIVFASYLGISLNFESWY